MCSSPVTFGGGTQITYVSSRARARAGLVEALLFPGLLPALLDAVRVVPWLHHRSAIHR